MAALLSIVVLSQHSFAQAVSQSKPSDSTARTTVKAEVRQVLLDIVVTDKKGHPVTSLHQQDFSVFEDGNPQQIISFEAHAASNFKPQLPPALPPNTFLNVSTGYDSLPLNILLYDLLNTPAENQPYARKQLVRFLHDKPAGSRFSIFVLGDKLQLLQGFTDDERQLVAAMMGKGAGTSPPSTYQTPQAVHDASTQLSDSSVLPNNPGAQGLLDRMQHLEEVAGNYFVTQRVQKTLDAFAQIARFVSGLPGRKNLIWLSGSFPATILPGRDPVAPFDTSLSYSADLRTAADLLTAAQIAVYPVDIRGLQVNPVVSADSPKVYRSPGSFGDAHSRFGQQLAAEHSTMDKIAEDSGGHAFYDTNGLQAAIADGTDDGANYYTLSYSPTNKKFDGSLRRIRIALTAKGYRLAYRHSYLADDSSRLVEKTIPPPDPFEIAMRRGAPASHDLVFEVHVAPQGPLSTVTPEQVRRLAQFPAFTSQKNWDAVKVQLYTIDFAILGRQLSFLTTANGSHDGKFEFGSAAYDADGSTIVGQRIQTDESFSQKDYDDVRNGAYRVRQQFEIPSGAAYLRLTVRDAIGQRLGSVEIPLPLSPEPQAETKTPAQ